MIDRLVEIYQEKLDNKEDRWNFTRTITNTRLYPLHILQRLRTGMIYQEKLDNKEDRWNFTRTITNTRLYPLHILQNM
jgi:16S rRNA G527 N7-methylase RsmG